MNNEQFLDLSLALFIGSQTGDVSLVCVGVAFQSHAPATGVRAGGGLHLVRDAGGGHLQPAGHLLQRLVHGPCQLADRAPVSGFARELPQKYL